ncbi:MAG: sugar ABC transporter permease [Anaerolineaceae bacterium]|nr:sugar ABC transporter permease [Anaerolineaceae bacterium]
MTVLAPLRRGIRMWREVNPRERRRWLTAYAFMSLQLIGLFVFILGPLVVSLYYTFTRWDLIAPAPKWVGLSNWEHVLGDQRIGQVLGNTVWFILWATSSFLILSLALAVLLNVPRRGTTLFRALFFLPYITSQVAVGLVWSWMFNTRSGPIPVFFRHLGIEVPNLLLDESYAMIAVAIVATWQALGYGITIYLAGLQGIPGELYDAASVDGATGWQRFRYVTLSLLSPTILFLTVTSFIAAFQLFDLVVILTGGATGVQPGGPGGSTRTIVLYLYEQTFLFSERVSGLGYGATIGWLLAVLIFIVTMTQFRFARSTVFYLGDDER